MNEENLQIKKEKMKQKLKQLHIQGKNWHSHNRNALCYILLSKKLECLTNIMLQDISNIEIPNCLFLIFLIFLQDMLNKNKYVLKKIIKTNKGIDKLDNQNR